MKLSFLEEPPAPGFDQMIQAELSVDDLLPVDAEYPAFSREMCCLLRELHAEGKKKISAPSWRTRLHSSRAKTLNRRLPPFVSADPARQQLGSTSTRGSILGHA